MTMEMINEIVQTFARQPVGYWWVLGSLVAILLVRRWLGSGRLLAFNNPTGRVMVSRSAIKGLIARTCQTIEGISHPQSRIYTRGGKLRVRVYVQLRGAVRLSDVSTLLQEKLDLALRQNLGIERIGRIDVIVTDIHPAAKVRPVSTSGTKAKAPYPWGAGEGYGE